MKRFSLILVATALLTGCQTPARQAWVRSEIYFGQSIPGGESIAPADWQAFLEETVTPQFPSGLTVYDTSGQWRNAAGHTDREPSKVLVLLHPPDHELESRIDAIRAEYCRRFKQEAVLKVTSKVLVAFQPPARNPNRLVP